MFDGADFAGSRLDGQSAPIISILRTLCYAQQ